MLIKEARQEKIIQMLNLPSVEDLQMIQKILVLTCLTVMMREEMLISIVRTTADSLQEMTAGLSYSISHSIVLYLYSRMSDSVSNATTTQKSSPVAVAGPTQFSKEMFAPPGPSTSAQAPPPASGGSTPGRPSRQDQLAELRMQMMHMQSKKKELEHNIANCPNEALKNRFRAELLTVATEIKRLEAGGFN